MAGDLLPSPFRTFSIFVNDDQEPPGIPLDPLKRISLELLKSKKTYEARSTPRHTGFAGVGVLAAGEMHGWGIAQRLSVLSKEALQLQEGALYPALYRMEARGDCTERTVRKRREIYRLTKRSAEAVRSAEKEKGDRLTGVVAQVLHNDEGGACDPYGDDHELAAATALPVHGVCFRRRDLEADMAEELRAHLEMEEAANENGQVSPQKKRVAPPAAVRWRGPGQGILS